MKTSLNIYNNIVSDINNIKNNIYCSQIDGTANNHTMLQIVLNGIQYNCQAIKRAQTQDNDSSYQEINRRLESINKMTALAYELGCHEQAHKIVRETLNVQAD